MCCDCLADGLPLKRWICVSQVDVEDCHHIGSMFQSLLDHTTEMHKDISTAGNCNTELSTCQKDCLHGAPAVVRHSLGDDSPQQLSDTHWPWSWALLLLQEHEPRCQNPATCVRKATLLSHIVKS